MLRFGLCEEDDFVWLVGKNLSLLSTRSVCGTKHILTPYLRFSVKKTFSVFDCRKFIFVFVPFDLREETTRHLSVAWSVRKKKEFSCHICGRNKIERFWSLSTHFRAMKRFGLCEEDDFVWLVGKNLSLLSTRSVCGTKHKIFV